MLFLRDRYSFVMIWALELNCFAFQHCHTTTNHRYNLGPNGGILTALNLFTTKFDQVLGFVEKRAPSLE